jgi:hypothetical protein
MRNHDPRTQVLQVLHQELETNRGDLTSILFYRRISLNTLQCREARISSNSLWIPCEGIPLPWLLPHSPTHTQHRTTAYQANRWEAAATHRESIYRTNEGYLLTQSSPQLYPPTTYGVSEYHPLPTMYPPTSTTPAAYPSYESSPGPPPTSSSAAPALSSSPGIQSTSVMPRVLNSRPKPQCWEHGCNGRQFSTFSNLLRHQREKSGTASKSTCPRCGAEFTRTTARNGHMAHDKCKPRRASEASS